MEENPYQAPSDYDQSEPSPPIVKPEKVSENSLEETILWSVAWAIALVLLAAIIYASL